MVEKTEVWLEKEDGEKVELATIEGSMPLQKGDEFYYSVREAYPKDIEDFRKRLHNYPESFLEGYLKDIEKECEEYHIKTFRVKSVSKSLSKDYSQGLNNEEKLVQFVTTIMAEPIRKIYE